MSIRQSRFIVLAVLALSCLETQFVSAAEQAGWSWSRMNPFHRDETKSQQPSATRKIAANRFKPTRSAVTKPKESPWKAVSNGSKKMVNGTKKLFTFGETEDAPVARRYEPPVLKQEPEKKKPSLTSWLPWSKTKTR